MSASATLAKRISEAAPGLDTNATALVDSPRWPRDLDWSSLLQKDGDALEVHYRHILEQLGKQGGMLGVIFRKSQVKIQDPAKLKRLVELINAETWVGLDTDVKGEIYEGLLEKNAEDTKSGADNTSRRERSSKRWSP